MRVIPQGAPSSLFSSAVWAAECAVGVVAIPLAKNEGDDSHHIRVLHELYLSNTVSR